MENMASSTKRARVDPESQMDDQMDAGKLYIATLPMDTILA